MCSASSSRALPETLALACAAPVLTKGNLPTPPEDPVMDDLSGLTTSPCHFGSSLGVVPLVLSHLPAALDVLPITSDAALEMCAARTDLDKAAQRRRRCGCSTTRPPPSLRRATHPLIVSYCGTDYLRPSAPPTSLPF